MKIAIISDIHANRSALDAVYHDIDLNGCNKILVLGDLIGYYYNPSYVVDKIKSDPRCVVIKGNHEDLLLKAINDESFAEQCHKKYGSGINDAIHSLSQEQVDWIQQLSDNITIEFDGIKLGLYHGSDKHINEYIYPDTRVERINRIDDDYDFLFFGHTHYPAIFPKKTTVIVNPGSVGQPRDVGSLASYAILNTDNYSIVFRRVPFSNDNLIEQSKSRDPHYPYLSEILERNNPYAKNYKFI